MNKRRLKTLADYLENDVPKKKFNLVCWMADSLWLKENEEDQKISTKTRDQKKFPSAFKEVGPAIQPVECQTVGCALGWGTTIPSFRKAGLVLVPNEVRRFLNDASEPSTLVADVALLDEKGKVIARHFDAAAKFFEITTLEAGWLFSPDEYRANQYKNPIHVVKRIRKLLDGSAKAVTDEFGYISMNV